MAVKREACQWISDQVFTTFGLGLAEPAHLRAQALELDPEPPLPFGWEKCFDLQTGVIFFRDASTGIRTSKDPRVHVKRQAQQPKEVDSEAWRGLSGSVDSAALDPPGDKQLEWMDRVQRFRGLEANTIDEKVSKWNQNYNTKKLPPLFSLKSTDRLPSLELSLRLESPHARDSSSLELSTVGDDKPGSLNEEAGHVELEQMERCRQNFLGPNHNMGPFPSNSIKVKEEPTSASLCWDQSPVIRNLPSSTFPIMTSNRRDGTETSATSPLEQHPEFRDLLGPKYVVGSFSSNGGHVLAEPMPSSADQLAGACTLDKVLMALERTQTHYETAVNNSVPTKGGTHNSNSFPPSSVDTKSKLPFSPLILQHPSMKVSSAAATLSPTTSDASSAVSSKSSLHSSTSPSVMSFQGEELDDLGGHGSSAEARTRSNVPSSTSTEPKVDDGQSPITLVAVGCMSCHMFVMLSKDNPSCPRCGKTGLLEVSPPRKRQRMENSPS